MKLLLTADLHAHPHRAFARYDADGQNSRLIDVMRVLDQIIESAADCGRTFIAGDLFHYSPPYAEAFNLLFDKMQKLNAKTKVTLLAGNHDLRGQYWTGNMDDIPFLKFERIGGVTIFDRDQPTLFSQDRMPMLSVVGLHHRRLEDVQKVIEKSPPADILLIHQDIVGAKVEHHTFETGLDRAMTDGKFKWVFGGHIHKPQQLSDRFVILGAPLHIDFGDAGDRGFWVLDLDKDVVEFRKTEFPRFLTVSAPGEVKEDGNFYRVAIHDPKKLEALKLPSAAAAIEDYVKTQSAPAKYAEVGKEIASTVNRAVLHPQDFTLTKIQLQNFGVFEKASLDIKAGPHMVLGEFEGIGQSKSNGAGKTTLFEGACWALYGVTSKGMRGTDVMRRGLKRGGSTVALVAFDSPKGPLVIERRQSASKATLTATLGDHTEEGGIPKVQEWIEHTLGVNYDFFRQMVYFSQEKAEFFTELGDAGKKQILSSLLGFAWYEDAETIAKARRQGCEERAQQWEQKARDATFMADSAASALRLAKEQLATWDTQQAAKIKEAEERQGKLLVDQTRLQAELEQRLAETVRRGALEHQTFDTNTIEEIEQLKVNLDRSAKARAEKTTKDAAEAGLRRTMLQEQATKLPAKDVIDSALIKAQGKKTKAEGGREQDREKLAELRAAYKRDEVEVKQLSGKIDSLGRLEIGIICPTCGSKITAENKGRCQKEMEASLATVRERMAKAKGEMTSLEATWVEAQTAYTEATNELKTLEEQSRSRGRMDQDVALAEKNYQLLQEAVARIEISSKEERERSLAAKTQEIEERRRALEREINSWSVSLKTTYEVKQMAVKASIDEGCLRLAQLRGEANPFAKAIAQHKADLQCLIAESEKADAEIAKAKEEIETYVFWARGFGREGIPAALVHDFCRIFTAEANDVLGQMGIGVTVELSPAKTLKSGEVRDRLEYIIHTTTGDSPYASLSGGEKARVDLTSMLVLHTLASRQFNIQAGLCGVLVLDEVCSALDEEGADLLTGLLNRFQSRTIFVISHDPQLKSVFPNVITVRRTGGASTIV